MFSFDCSCSTMTMSYPPLCLILKSNDIGHDAHSFLLQWYHCIFLNTYPCVFASLRYCRMHKFINFQYFFSVLLSYIPLTGRVGAHYDNRNLNRRSCLPHKWQHAQTGLRWSRLSLLQSFKSSAFLCAGKSRGRRLYDAWFNRVHSVMAAPMMRAKISIF